MSETELERVTCVPRRCVCSFSQVYMCNVYDPEGALGSLTAIIAAFLGMQAGRVVLHYQRVSHWQMIVRWLGWGLLLCVIATALCGGKENSGIMPLNKNLWSPSFVAALTGTGVWRSTSRRRSIDISRE